MYIIIHETSIKGLLNIFRVEKLFKSSTIKELGLRVGQGSPDRRLATDPTVSLSDKEFYNKYDEVDGVYFRLLEVVTPVKSNHGGDCIMIFSKNILEDSDFVINTEENFGFCIAKDGVLAESQYSGEQGMSVTTIKNLPLLSRYNFDPYSSEIVILDDVDLSHLKCVFVKSNLISAQLIDECYHKKVQLYALSDHSKVL